MGTCAQASISYIDPYSQRSADGDVSFTDRSASPRSAGVSLTVVKQMEANGARYLPPPEYQTSSLPLLCPTLVCERID